MAVVTAEIKNLDDDQMMNSDFDLLSIDVSKEFNKVPTAELKLIDGDVTKKKFKILDSKFFEPGKKIEITLKYEGKPKDKATIFVGIVVNQSLELNSVGPTLTLELCDETIKMTKVRKNAVYSNKEENITDKTIIEDIIKNQYKLKHTVDQTSVKHTQMIQYYATDWDFIVSRAEANGQLVRVSDGTISVIQPNMDASVVELELGKHEIYDFDLQINGYNQYAEVSAIAWDVNSQKVTKTIIGEDHILFNANEKKQIDEITKAVGTETNTLVQATPMDIDELQSWSDAKLLKSRLSMVRGWIKIPGTIDFEVGKTIEIKEVGTNFTGRNIISGVRHEVTNEGWVTHLQIGMDANWFTSKPDIIDTPAAGLLPGINGLQIGKVKELKTDTNQFRIKVCIPAFGTKKNTVWARLATMDAGKKHGTFFTPQLEDEVVVGFLNDDPRHAIILGSLYNPKNQPPLSFDENNKSKGIFTESGYKLLFDEDEKIITLATSDNNRICIDEKQKSIHLEDPNGNQIELSKNGMVINSAGDLEIKTKGDLNIDAKGAVKIKGKKVDMI
ncbi:type VI secretion system tip protein VgrG [Aquimarina sp. MMG016]|uniref:type VI secretion system tip protein VgrG n=1 Tax=Aquimarina sp. MMG016 TaxID=2822690 RepID=UPI001B39EB97|nr:type VI secretion system tip protein VgrG [Aquimarina sp. MMG016]MBQ4820700.1 type VI secretion system tip protein VgrG [Aquimarina sp. MMG016]